MRNALFILITALILSSCATSQKIIYLQNQPINELQPLNPGKNIAIEPLDQISIVVSSKDPQLASIFNLPRIQQIAGAQQGVGEGASSGQMSGYTVDSKGYIDFPILGELKVQGLAREELARLIKVMIIEQGHIKDPIVTIDFMNLGFYAMGEVASPGQYPIKKDQVTILDALSTAGDLTIYGRRDKVFLIRRVGDSSITYQLDMRSSDIYKSPAFYVQQNDVIYVEPNGVRANQSTVNGNTARSVSLWMSVASFLTTLGVLFLK